MTKTILLLNSDSRERAVTQAVLERAGYSVVEAGNLGKAVDAVRTCTPHLLIIHSYIDNSSGHSAAKYLRVRCPGMRVLLVNGMIDDDELVYREELEGFESFPRPFNVTDFLEKVHTLLSAVPAITARVGNRLPPINGARA